VGKIVAVAGNVASGKSTLAAALAAHFGWPHLPEGNYDRTYLDDLFADPVRWSFEAQMAFLAHKADAVDDAMRRKDPVIVLDRSLAEDVFVFAAYFHERGWMSDRAHALYMRYANALIEQLDEPALTIYCFASAKVCESRLADRPRHYQALYPSDHLTRLHDLYERWWSTVDPRRKLPIDTSAIDARQPHQAKQLAERIGELLHAL
jgi:deoxyadenosine/deoxycytidine kinase